MARKNKKAPQASNLPAIAATPSPGKLVVQAMYDAARQGRRLSGWNPPSSGPNKSIANLQTIRNRSRDSVRNETTAASTIRNLVVDLVGTGIIARPQTKKASTKTRLTELWKDFIKNCDADGVLDFNGLQELGVRTWKEAGEVFIRLRPRRLDDGLAVPLQIQLIEPELCALFDADSWPGLPAGNRIRQGVELDRIGRRVAYWMHKEHPGDGNVTIGASMLYRVPASEIRHMYKVKRPGQLRGVPEGTSVMVKQKMMGDYDDAVVEANKLKNLFVGVITKPSPVAGSVDTDPLTGLAIEHDSIGNQMVSMEPGAMIELAAGETVNFSSPPAVGVGYDEFMRQQNMSIAAGGSGVPYEIMSGDILNISDRTLRQVIQQYRRHIEQEQWTVAIPMFCQPIRDAWAEAAVLAGAIPMSQLQDAKDVHWSPQAWAYIHPVQDVQAKTAEIAAGITSRDAVISARGDDPEQIDIERAAGKQREESLGISLPPPDPKTAAADKKQKNAAAAAKASAEERLLIAQASAAQADAEAAIARAKAYGDAQAAQAAQAHAEAAYSAARTDQAIAESLVAEANCARIKAEGDAALAAAEYHKAIAAQESDARIAECLSRTNAARADADARADALRTAEAFAAELRAETLAAEKARTETARIEMQAAQLGLSELRDDE